MISPYITCFPKCVACHHSLHKHNFGRQFVASLNFCLSLQDFRCIHLRSPPGVFHHQISVGIIVNNDLPLSKVHSFIRSFIHSFTPLFIHSFIHSLLYSFTPFGLPFFLPSFIPCLLTSLLSSFHYFFTSNIVINTYGLLD